MAISQSDGSIILNTKVDTSGVDKGFSSIKSGAKGAGSAIAGLGAKAVSAFLAIGAAATTAAVAIVKSSVDAYADYEQLVGGVETLFKGSAQKVIDYANDAFYTAGVSANEYMKQVTSFSASLIRSTANDTDKAADIANMALIDISDNVNKMGSSMESVTIAYQGFAKQQYMLLDNLKLGYGGTKTEMERLLKDAQALTGVEYNISNLADVYTAIHVIQENLGIAGTTALEAEKTISGSAATMKASWENVLTAISGGGDLDKAIENLVDSIETYFENIVPVVERSLVGIGKLIEKVAPMLVQSVTKSLISAIPSLLNAVYEMIIGLAKGIYEGIMALFTEAPNEALEEQTENIKASVKNQNDLKNAVEETADAAQKSLAGFDELNVLTAETAEEQSSIATSTNSGAESTTSNNAIAETEKQTTALGRVWDTITTKASEIGSVLYNNFKSSIDAIAEEFPKVADAGKDAFETIGKATTKVYKKSIAPLADKIANEFVPEIVNATTENLAPIASDLGAVYLESFAETYDWAAEKIEKATNDLIEPALETLTEITTDTMEGIGEAWDQYGEDIVEQTALADDQARSLWDSLYEKVAQPIFAPLMEEINKLWNEHLKPLWDELVLFFDSIWELALTLWNNVLSPIINQIILVAAPLIVNVINRIRDIFSTVIGIIVDVVTGLIQSLRGLIDFITGVFQGDWEQAWNGIKDFVGGIWDMIWGIIKGVVNLIIDGLNTLWSGVYAVFAGIANGIGNAVGWVGKLFGQDWRFSMPSEPPLIPKLAQGAVIPPNKEFLAVLGDQRSGTNIEAPLDTIKQAVAEVLAQANVGGGFNGRIEVPVIINGREVARAVREAEGNLGSQTVFGGFANVY